MLNKVLNDFYRLGEDTYTDILPTVARVTHFALNYPEAETLVKKYGGDFMQIKHHLLLYINQRQNNLSKIVSQMVDPRFGQLQENKQLMPLNELARVLHEEFQVITKNAYDIEIKKIMDKSSKNPNLSAMNTINPEVTMSSYLRAIFESLDGNNIDLKEIFEREKFQVKRFLEDDRKGKSETKGVLKEYCQNLNELALEGKIFPAIGREKELNRTMNILKKLRKNNPILVGEAGVGKTAIVEGLALQITRGDVPDFLKNAVIYNLQVMNMVKGTQFRGQFEERMSQLLEEFKELEESGEIFPILFIDEIHTIMGSGNGNSLDFSNIIKPALARGTLRTIGSTTNEEWHKFIKENTALDRRFYPVKIKEPSKKDTYKMIQGIKHYYENAHDVVYTDEAINKSIELSDEYLTQMKFPDKAIDLLDEAGVISYRQEKEFVNEIEVKTALVALHPSITMESLEKKYDDEKAEEFLRRQIYGQEEAIKKVSIVIDKYKSGLKEKDKPIGSLLFSGPTGTGKTEMAKLLAEYTKAYFHRVDMSEFMEAHSVSKFLGAPAGYVGYDNGSSLGKVLIENPKTVLLLDEIEKAHPNVLDILLQVMDHSRLIDSKGKTINFNNVLLIMTSNVGGVSMITNSIGFSREKKNPSNDIKKFFKPEFLGRLTGSGPILFNQLSHDDLGLIFDNEIKKFEQRSDIHLKVAKSMKDHIVKIAEGKGLGARPIKDLIEELIVTPLSQEILYGTKKSEYKISYNKKTILK
jgi:ATP-dependent Clp protease ATP-binding subunit ClpA